MYGFTEYIKYHLPGYALHATSLHNAPMGIQDLTQMMSGAYYVRNSQF